MATLFTSAKIDFPSFKDRDLRACLVICARIIEEGEVCMATLTVAGPTS